MQAEGEQEQSWRGQSCPWGTEQCDLLPCRSRFSSLSHANLASTALFTAIHGELKVLYRSRLIDQVVLKIGEMLSQQHAQCGNNLTGKSTELAGP